MNIVGTKRDQGREQASPHALDRPSPEAIIDGCRRAVDRWAVLPATARLQHMDNAADHTPVVYPMRARLVLWQKRLDHRPLPVRQPELSSHDLPPLAEVNHNQSISINILIGFRP